MNVLDALVSFKSKKRVGKDIKTNVAKGKPN